LLSRSMVREKKAARRLCSQIGSVLFGNHQNKGELRRKRTPSSKWDCHGRPAPVDSLPLPPVALDTGMSRDEGRPLRRLGRARTLLCRDPRSVPTTSLVGERGRWAQRVPVVPRHSLGDIVRNVEMNIRQGIPLGVTSTSIPSCSKRLTTSASCWCSIGLSISYLPMKCG
jgi:hypothetical protein